VCVLFSLRYPCILSPLCTVYSQVHVCSVTATEIVKKNLSRAKEF
jgi:hypothetical protein